MSELEDQLDGIGEMTCPWDGSILEEIAARPDETWTARWAASFKCPHCGCLVTSPQIGFDPDAGR